MHPLLAHYLSLNAAVDTLRRDERGEVLKASERFYAHTARSHPDKKDTLLATAGNPHLGEDTQGALVFLAAHAALHALAEDEAMGEKLASAREALKAEGATDEEANQLFASLLLEEAFGYDDGADAFDQAYFAETVDSVPTLAALTRERLLQMHDAFARTANPTWREAHQLVARALLEEAFDEGPQPINPEHVQTALERATAELGTANASRAKVTLKRLLFFLHKAELIGALRLDRLSRAVDEAFPQAPSGLPN
ncbi:MAG: hypothetical protein ACOZIN_13480 [Myxococcota bacterium]